MLIVLLRVISVPTVPSNNLSLTYVVLTSNFLCAELNVDGPSSWLTFWHLHYVRSWTIKLVVTGKHFESDPDLVNRILLEIGHFYAIRKSLETLNVQKKFVEPGSPLPQMLKTFLRPWITPQQIKPEVLEFGIHSHIHQEENIPLKIAAQFRTADSHSCLLVWAKSFRMRQNLKYFWQAWGKPSKILPLTGGFWVGTSDRVTVSSATDGALTKIYHLLSFETKTGRV